MMTADIQKTQAQARRDKTASPEALYLDLMKKCLTRYIFTESWKLNDPVRKSLRFSIYFPFQRFMDRIKAVLTRRNSKGANVREEGRDMPLEAETMVGLKRLDNIQECIANIIKNQVDGDLIETGVWRGGATIFMRAVLKAYNVTDRTVWVADSFAGLPKGDAKKYPADSRSIMWLAKWFAVSVDEVKANFTRYGLLDNQVKFLVGWFRDTLPTAPIEKLALLRLDGDMYESTLDGLNALYDKVSSGGYIIVDDYGAYPQCKKAVDEFRAARNITDPILPVDWTGAYWQKSHA